MIDLVPGAYSRTVVGSLRAPFLDGSWESTET
jgi:hypothetical protein